MSEQSIQRVRMIRKVGAPSECFAVGDTVGFLGDGPIPDGWEEIVGALSHVHPAGPEDASAIPPR